MDEGDGFRLTLTRVLPASRERVFRMLTEPAELVTWWDRTASPCSAPMST